MYIPKQGIDLTVEVGKFVYLVWYCDNGADITCDLFVDRTRYSFPVHFSKNGKYYGLNPIQVTSSWKEYTIEGDSPPNYSGHFLGELDLDSGGYNHVVVPEDKSRLWIPYAKVIPYSVSTPNGTVGGTSYHCYCYRDFRCKFTTVSGHNIYDSNDATCWFDVLVSAADQSSAFTITPTQNDIDDGLYYSVDGATWHKILSTSPLEITADKLFIVSETTLDNLGMLRKDQTLTPTLSATTVGYGDTPPTLTVTGAKTALSYSSSNTAVATITSGKIAIVGLGSTVFTISAAETSDYKAASATISLTVNKGNITVKVLPTAGNLIYGQTLQASKLSGGSAVNGSGSDVAGSWDWKSSTATPNVGKQTFVARYTPTDTSHYNY